MKQLFVSDPAYKQMAQEYEKKDTLRAVVLYLCIVLLYSCAGYLIMTTGSVIPAILINYLLVALVLIAVRMCNQKLNTVGLTLKNFKQSFAVGMAIGLVISVCADIIPTLLSGGRWLGAGEVLWNFFYMLTNIVFAEELVFRGYIQTRLLGAMKSDIAAVIARGILFMGMHIPFRVFNRSGGNLIDFFATNGLWLLSTFIFHLLFNFLYRKYNSLTAPIMCHFVINFGSTLFG